MTISMKAAPLVYLQMEFVNSLRQVQSICDMKFNKFFTNLWIPKDSCIFKNQLKPRYVMNSHQCKNLGYYKKGSIIHCSGSLKRGVIKILNNTFDNERKAKNAYTLANCYTIEISNRMIFIYRLQTWIRCDDVHKWDQSLQCIHLFVNIILTLFLFRMKIYVKLPTCKTIIYFAMLKWYSRSSIE